MKKINILFWSFALTMGCSQDAVEKPSDYFEIVRPEFTRRTGLRNHSFRGAILAGGRKHGV